MVNIVLKHEDYNDMVNADKRLKDSIRLLKTALELIDRNKVDETCSCPKCDEVREIREFIKQYDN
jgi:hypothetical protein